jgi:branched-chain amino acid transport system permease protein
MSALQKTDGKKLAFYAGILAVSIAAPFVMPNFSVQLSYLWLMVLFSLTWDVVGGQMGYNSFGNVVFFGLGMYVTAVTQRDLYYSIAEYATVAGRVGALTPRQYLTGLSLGLGLSAVAGILLALIFGWLILRLRGHYFAICTLGIVIAAGDIAAGIDYIGAGSGLVTPVFPAGLGDRGLFYYFIFFILAAATFITLKWLYSTRFGLAINAIRDDEDKAEAMGINTTRYKVLAWTVAAFFLSLAGGAMGNLIGFIDPVDTAFAGTTFGVWMILMAILGGKGTLWGPVIGAMIFQVTQELFWTYLLGWQRIALGALIIIIVVFFPQGIMGFVRHNWPELMGYRIEAHEEKEAA